jgi:hypothetical protein
MCAKNPIIPMPHSHKQTLQLEQDKAAREAVAHDMALATQAHQEQVDQAQRFITFWDGQIQGAPPSDISPEMAKASLTPVEPMVSGTPPPPPTMVNTLPSARCTGRGQRCIKMK